VNRIFRSITTALLLLLLATPALAQSSALIYHDAAGQLNRAQVTSAAQKLIARGAQVAIYTVNSNGGADDFQRQLEADGLAQGGSIKPNVIAIYVSYNPRYSEIRAGDKWNAALKTNNNIDAIRNNELNAGLRDNDATTGVVNTLTAIDQAIANPPQAGGGTSVNVGSGTFTPIVLGVIFLLLLFVGGPILWRSFSKRRAVAQAYARARQAAEDARKQAGAAIADMGQVMKSAQEKAQYDQVSYPAADVEQLARIQGTAEAQFVKAQEQFDKAGEALAAKREPTQEEYQSAAGDYGAVTALVEQARGTLDQAEARRAELDKLNAAAPGEVDHSKKALADAAERLQALGQDFPRPDAVLRPGQDLVARAESLLAEHRAADAIAAARAASATIDQLNGTLASYSDIREGISAGRTGAEKATGQGYRVEAGLAALDRSEGLLRDAAGALEQDVAKARALLEQAEAARAEGVARGGGMPALRKANDEHLALVEQAGQQLAGAITEGRKAFDLVDEFAENTWSDIRGNGSEAEAAAARAHSLWERASQRNTMDEQDFLGAQQDLDEADKQIAFTRTLVDAITQRLRDLQAARDTAQQEIGAAQQDIDQGWGYVHSNDPDVGKLPEQALAQAAQLLKQANAELAKQRPDWLAIVKQAQEANHLADQALANARSEVEAMNKLREQATHAQQLATAEVQKIVQFTSIHAGDIPASSEQKLNQLQADVQQAYAALKAAEQAAEQVRAADLREAITRYIALQDSADKLYDEIYGAFQRVEKLRKQVDAEVDRAASAVAQAERLLQAYASFIRPRSPGIELLEQARALLASIGSIHNEADSTRALATATEARNAAERAARMFQDQAQAYQSANQRDGGIGDFVAGAVIGSLLSGSGDRPHHHGGGGGSWGGGSSSGGSWGGGSSSGGSWGGGSSSGGGW
jgi:uncharacterized membrane protein YgcG